jgi:hypothetical protein
VKAALVFTGTGPIAILTSHDSLTGREVASRLEAKGIRKYLAFEVPLEEVRTKYGAHFETVMADLRQEDELRVLDEDGNHVYAEFSLRTLGPLLVVDP